MLFNLDITADNPAGHWHGLSSPDPATRQGASPTSTVLNMISQRFATKPTPSREAESTGTRSNVVSPCASSTHLSIGEVEDEPEPIEYLQDDVKPPEKKATRTKTSFQLAHPPRNARHERLRIRPKLLLQLQQISRTTRPVPTLDVLPSAIFAHKMVGKFPSMFRGKDRIGPNDLVVVTSESYKAHYNEDDVASFASEDDPSGHRELVASICPARKEEGRMKGKAEISLNRGLTWEATLLPNGSYDFVAADEHGVQTTVRWARRSKNNRRASSSFSGAPGSADENKRFTFSIMDPTTRRHPVIASMTKKSIDVLDKYPVTPKSANTDTPVVGQTPTTTPSKGATASQSDSQAEFAETDDNLRALIVATGIWVVFREGWANMPLGCLPPPVSPTAPRTPIPHNAEPEKEEQLNAPTKETPRSSFHTVRTKFLHKSQAPTEPSMLAVPETQASHDNQPSSRSPNLTISTSGHADPGRSQPTSPNISTPVPRVRKVSETSRNHANENEDNAEPSQWKNDDNDDQNGIRDSRHRANTHPPGTEKRKGKRWRRFSSMLDSMGRKEKEKSGHTT